MRATTTLTTGSAQRTCSDCAWREDVEHAWLCGRYQQLVGPIGARSLSCSEARASEALCGGAGRKYLPRQ